MELLEKCAGICQKRAGGAEDFGCDGCVIGMRCFIAGCTISEPRLDVHDQTAFEGGSENVVVGHLVNRVAEDRFERSTDELEGQLMAILETLDDAVPEQFRFFVAFSLCQPQIKLLEGVFE